MPKISIIIPAFNVEKYLGECIDSVLAQSFADYEVIVVDDGSSDNTLEVAVSKASKDPRVKVAHQENAGPSAARNNGLEMAKGEWIVFVDGDDMLLPGALDVFNEVALQTEADIICASSTDKYLAGVNLKKANLSSTKHYTPVQGLTSILYQKELTASVWAKMYKRSVWERVRFTTGILYEDLDVIYRVFSEARKVVYIDTEVYYYRSNPNSILHTFNSQRFDVLDVTRRIEEQCRDNAPSLLRAANDRRMSAAFNMLGLIYAHGVAGEYADRVKECTDVITHYRRQAITDPNVRLKNKCGALLSYLGFPVLNRILIHHYR
ncbi:MAG: glycosyltransferase [Muribaculaceae bacterium]|nr:glycosyltransferase [Muribaculaceae bacterium]